MRELGIYGGTFSPIHAGHVNAARQFYDALRLDELLIMPDYLPPHKQAVNGASPEDRLAMAKLAFAGEKRRITVSEYETEQQGKSYTYLTLQHFASQEVRLTFLCGTDMFLSLDSWRHPEIIFSLARIALILREDAGEAEEAAIAERQRYYEKTYGAVICRIDTPPVAVSSTEVRNRLQDGRDVSGLLPLPVLRYILENRLYGAGYPAFNRFLRQEILRYTGEKRYLHILGTEKTADGLAKLYDMSGEDREKLKTAALLHDITKYYTAEEHRAVMERQGLTVPAPFLESEKTLHALTGACLAKELYPAWTDDFIFSAIRFHTTGRADMTLPEKLLYLADFIEPTRTFPDCVGLREFFEEGLAQGKDKYRLLDDALRFSFAMTVKELTENGWAVHPDTLTALAFLNDRSRKDNTMEINENNENIENTVKEPALPDDGTAGMRVPPRELAEQIVRILDMHKAADIRLLRTTDKTTLADYFVICGGNSNTQVRGFCGELEYELGQKTGITPRGIEGFDTALWILMDYGTVVVHIFNAESRKFYNLEKLWQEAEEIDISSLLTED